MECLRSFLRRHLVGKPVVAFKISELQPFVLLLCTIVTFNCLILKGMNVKEFKYKWGGEDWDLLDRVVNAQLEVERIKYPGLYHHYHTKQKMWS